MLHDKRSFFLAGNWKMHGLKASLTELESIDTALLQADDAIKTLLCLPATLIAGAAGLQLNKLLLGGQDCHFANSGAYTGDIAAPQLCDAGASWVILGHSERRMYHCESDDLIAKKITAAQQAGLSVILCLGEQLNDYENDLTLDIITKQFTDSIPNDVQIDKLAIAYEPVWAIGSGKVPNSAEIAKVHAHLNTLLEQLKSRLAQAGDSRIPLLYGGSVKASNVADIVNVPHVDGVLVGGASLKAADFLDIYHAIGQNMSK